MALIGVPFLVAIAMSLVDSYRRRGKRPKPFPTRPPESVPVGEGQLTTFTYGNDLYEAMLEAIEGARSQILFETYIWKGDAMGERFKRALIDAADRGVDVYCTYDAFANLVVSPAFKRFPGHVKVLRYPVYGAGWRFFDIRRYGRDHRKILVVDDNVGFIGGYNVGSAYATEWRDTHVKITGPAVWDLKRAFADFWNLHRRRRIGSSERPLLLETASTWEPRVRVQRNVPRLLMFPIRAMYIEAINRASRNVWMTQAYFLPDQDFVDAVKNAALRGVDVRLLLPLKSNHIVADWVSRGYFSQMLDAGVRILRYRDAMVHAKTATVDGRWATVGTANIDRLSLQGNYEINLEVIDEGFARELEAIFEVDQSHCLELTSGEWEARDMHRKFTEMLLTPLRPLL
ncbi:phosphatidylserine/phosphatidylglycerophosphate/cardiolipin synthase family protein [Nocardioides sp. zg-536]|uniref:Phosphatidylserine/phosphatidylglycerophosphate/ cardiolipin synthase family protein n=2 Tax=Nocardioides faecalis TaxID=2803858 RepID=A0A939BTF4_9ACTN|nr:phosphatidylserine/phosphatidylglycerophosphate/cardiolipin synthase family protein [Nocardioides faecalis]MBS4754339.1 phosphatidylserine/phosphatidylglycerophosphate/cardiolipin synthase family protein [Nocardioides faecalis]QVI60596.1 phosphatidylserine/phosphatidylglycerophosphate/cardiolipin synthase family protein [Nocardioides faecalis]